MIMDRTKSLMQASALLLLTISLGFLIVLAFSVEASSLDTTLVVLWSVTGALWMCTLRLFRLAVEKGVFDDY
jgi:hypothetical protein